LDFTKNSEAKRAALDEIIKFNCNINEFNFMQKIFSHFRTELLYRKKKTRTADWVGLFTIIDKNNDGLISKQELRESLVQAGMFKVSDAEV
jgi:Ca2+-binding EF-hand superfamily protein